MIKTSERSQWGHCGFFVANFEHILHIFLVFLLFTLNNSMFAGKVESRNTISSNRIGLLLKNFVTKENISIHRETFGKNIDGKTLD